MNLRGQVTARMAPGLRRYLPAAWEGAHGPHHKAALREFRRLRRLVIAEYARARWDEWERFFPGRPFIAIGERHGALETAYQLRCQCEPCRTAITADNRRRVANRRARAGRHHATT